MSIREIQKQGALFVAGVLLAGSASFSASAALAQGAEAHGLADIIVTAEKRETSLQSTPLAISALDETVLRERGVTDALDLGELAPNLTTTVGPNTSDHLIIHIRGIGESEPNLAMDSPVGIYVDGVVLGRSTGAIFDVVDLERVEVLRGPQGTLYGRNTTGGAVNLITRKPGDKFGVRLLGSIGNRSALKGRISVDTGDIAGSGVKATLTYFHKQSDGYLEAPLQNARRWPGAYNNEAARAAVRFDNGGPFRADYTFDWMEAKGTSPASQLAAVGPLQLAYFSQSPNWGGRALNGPSQGRIGSIYSEGTFTYTRILAHSLVMEADLADNLTVRSITGIRKWKNNVLNTDIDGNEGLRGLTVDLLTGGTSVGPVTMFGADNFNRQRQISQEIDVLGDIGRLEYVLGGFYFYENAEANNPQSYTYVIANPAAPGGAIGLNLRNDLHYKTRNESLAAFGQLTYHLTDALSVMGGVRYTKDEKLLNQIAPADLVRVLQRGFSKVNYAASLQYQATPDLLLYGRVASGYKAGGFNPRAVNEGYDPENVTNFEVGFKSELFERRLRFNATAFYMKLNDKQVNQFLATPDGGAASVTINAAKGKLKGVELEMDALPVPFLRLNGSFGYTDYDWDSFLIEDPGHPGVMINIADQARLSYMAKTTFTGGAQLQFGDIGFGRLTARADLTYRGRVHYNVIPFLTQFDADIESPPVWLLDGRVALGEIPLPAGKAEIALWGKNLTNRTYRVSGIDFGSLGFATSTYGVPRTWGVDIRYQF